MRRRVANKVERQSLVDKVCELQRQICEYERYIGDMLVMLCKGEAQCVLEHDVDENAKWVWEEVKKLIKEQKDAEKANKE